MANLSSYLPDGINESNVAITGGSINGTTIGASTAAAGTFTTFTSNGIDDNADATAITIDSNENVGIATTSPSTTLQVNGTSRVSDGTTNIDAVSASGVGYFGTQTNHPLVLRTNDTERLRIDTSGNFCVGTTTAAAKAVIKGTGDLLRLESTNGSSGGAQIDLLHHTASPADDDDHGIINFGGYYSGTTNTYGSAIKSMWTDVSARQAALKFFTRDGGTLGERMRIDSSGRLLVGKTAADNTTVGCRLNASGDASFVADGNRALVVVRNSSDGQLAIFLKDSTYVGQINARSAQLSIGNLGTGIEFNDGNDAVIPFSLSANNTRDNALDLGMSSVRWDDVYATNGTIQTSDINEKQDIEELTEAEQRVAVAAKALLRKFRWKSAVRTKSHDARTHFGIIAQELQAAFEAEGLDAGEYGMFTCSEWWETYTDVPAVQAVEAQDAVYDEEGNLVSEAVEAVEAVEAHTRTDTYNTEAESPEDAVRKERMGVRYSELLAFIIAAI